MKKNKIKELITLLGFKPQDGEQEVYYKSYPKHKNYTIKVNFEKEIIEYGILIRIGDVTTSNFVNSENFVVLECIDRILEKGYPPDRISLEHKWPMGRKEKGKLDILITDNDDKSYLMIECKTWGEECEKEKKKMQRDGGQLFSYFQQDKSAQYLCLYSSRLEKGKIEFVNDIVKVNDLWRELNNQKEIHDHWNKNFKDNGIFDDWANAYDIEIKALTRGRLKELSEEDSGRIFNQFAEILRHNVVSDKPNAFNKILNLFICKIIDEDKNENEEVAFQWLENDSNESLQIRLNDLYKEGMKRFLDIEVTDYNDRQLEDKLYNINEPEIKKQIQEMFQHIRLQKNPEFAFKEVYNEKSFNDNAMVVKEVVELLQTYQFRYGHKQQFLGDFFELLLSTSIKQEAGQFFTPVPIAKFIISCFPIKEFILKRINDGCSDILPFSIDYATGSGHFLTELMDEIQSIIDNFDTKGLRPTASRRINSWKQGQFEWAKEYIYGIEADYRLVKTTKVSSFLNGDGEAIVIRADGLDNFQKSLDYRGKLKEVSLDDPKENGHFDILVANPPYSVSAFKNTLKNGDESFELYNRLTDDSSEIECLFIERTKQLLRPGGWAGIILPSSILNNSGIYTDTREIILKYFEIKAIVEFGSNTFMATGTNTVALFLVRRHNTEHKKIEQAIKVFFENTKEATVNGIENVFSKYVKEAFDNITLADYITFIHKEPNDNIKSQELFIDYKEWFEGLSEIKQLKEKKVYKDKPLSEQKAELEKLFYEKVFSREQDKMLYFILIYPLRCLLIKVGEKQAEKDFIGYEFSSRRGHEGIKMYRDENGKTTTSLYDDGNILNPEKANYYIYNRFLDKSLNISKKLCDNITECKTIELMDFKKLQFEKSIILGLKKKAQTKSKWDLVKLGNITTIMNGGTPNTRIKEYWNGIINWATLVDTKEKYLSKTQRTISESGLKNSNAVLLPLNTVIFSSRATIGDVAIAKINTSTNQGFKNFICDETKVLPEYLYYILKKEAKNIEDLASGMTYKEISKQQISEYKIPLPPLKVQEKIINELNYIEKKEEYDKNELCNLRIKLGELNFDNYPEIKLGKIALMIKRGKSAKYGNSKIQIIKSGQARGYANFDFTTKYYVTNDYVSDERNLKIGDILINSTGVGTAGRVTLFNLNGNFVVDSHITIVRPNTNLILPKFLLYSLAKIGFKNIEKMATGQSGQIELSLSIISNIRICLPPIDQQTEFVSRIENIEKKIQNIESELAHINQEKEAVMKKYL